MAFKRRRFGHSGGSGASSHSMNSSRPPASSPQTINKISSVSQNTAPCSPALPSLPHSSRISFRPSQSQASVAQSDADVIRAFEGETEEDVELRENADAMNEIIMAIDMRDRGTIGCAYYIARDEKLYLMEDIKMAGLEVIDTMKLHANPTVVLISTRSEEALENHLSRDARGIDRGDDASTS